MPEQTDSAANNLRLTPLHRAHLEHHARMVPFAGYDMPVQYPTGIIEEHVWTRTHASIFDISHMGQALVVAADGRHETAAAALEALVPADIVNLAPGQQRYSQLLNSSGGVIDDLMVTRPADAAETGNLQLIVNASRKEVDFEHLAQRLGDRVRIEPQPHLALLAIQGPKASEIFGDVCPESRRLDFMQSTRATIGSLPVYIARSGYTGEDGFEISVAADDAVTLWQTFLACESVRPCGLGARDSLRLEAGLCLYGHELDETISPVEAGLTWSIQPRRRKLGDFPGASRILREIADGPQRIKVGIALDGRAPARDGAEILSTDGNKIGIVTSGGYAPTLKSPIALGYVTPENGAVGTRLKLVVRGAPLDARVVKLPFVPHNYHRAQR